jgi:hypothetical protein
MERSALYIRLVVATTASAASALFVAIYCFLSLWTVPSRFHVKLDDLMRWLPRLTQYVVACRWYAFFVPAFLCAFGVFALHRWKNRAAFEVAVGCQWLFVVIWSALCVLAWMLLDMPQSGTTHGAG